MVSLIKLMPYCCITGARWSLQHSIRHKQRYRNCAQRRLEVHSICTARDAAYCIENCCLFRGPALCHSPGCICCAIYQDIVLYDPAHMPGGVYLHTCGSHSDLCHLEFGMSNLCCFMIGQLRKEQSLNQPAHPSFVHAAHQRIRRSWRFAKYPDDCCLQKGVPCIECGPIA